MTAFRMQINKFAGFKMKTCFYNAPGPVEKKTITTEAFYRAGPISQVQKFTIQTVIWLMSAAGCYMLLNSEKSKVQDCCA